jgi:hypothetical protein
MVNRLITYQNRIAHPQKISRRMPDLPSLKPYFGWVDEKRIEATLARTTQFYRATIHHPFRKHFKSRFPAANVNRLLEWYATDTVLGMVPAADNGIAGHSAVRLTSLPILSVRLKLFQNVLNRNILFENVPSENTLFCI